MNSLLQLKTIRPLLITLTLICFALLPQLKAQCPSDCNGNSTAVGNNALNLTNTGFNNTAVGASALTANTTGGFNVAGCGVWPWPNTSGPKKIAFGGEIVPTN